MENIEAEPPQEKSDKQTRWEEISAGVDGITDKLGEKIDPNIKEAVIALKALDINASQSCEGHLDRGIAAPWIDIVDKKVLEAVKQIDWKKKLTTEQEIEERKILDDFAERKNLELQKKIIEYLDAFYKHRESPFDKRLVIQNRNRTGARIESQGASLQKIADAEIKKQKLAEYQEEMRTFTEFLKKIFFESN